MPTTFSVVIATRNQRDLLRQALDSVLLQSRAPDEVIVVDDGSADGTLEALGPLLSDVRALSQPSLGQSIARNSGVAAATGEWVCFLDHDDLWHRDKLAEVERYLDAEPGCVALNHPVWFFTERESGPAERFGFPRDFVAADLEACHAAVEGDPPARHDDAYLRIRGDSYRRLLVRNAGALSATVVRRDVAIRAGCFPPGHAEDWRFFRNVARFAEWHTLERRLAFVRLHEAQATVTEVSSAHVLAAFVDAWWGGRPEPERATDDGEVRRLLGEYGASYRAVVQAHVWGALRRHRWRQAALDRRLGGAVLPRWRDRAWASLPPGLTWRWEHRRSTGGSATPASPAPPDQARGAGSTG